MDQAIIELVEDLEQKVRRYQKRLVEYQIAIEDLNKKIQYLENKIEKIKRGG